MFKLSGKHIVATTLSGSYKFSKTVSETKFKKIVTGKYKGDSNKFYNDFLDFKKLLKETKADSRKSANKGNPKQS